MSATDILTLSLFILGLLGAAGIYFGVALEKPAITLVSTAVGYVAISLLVFILMVALGAIVVADTLG